MIYIYEFSLFLILNINFIFIKNLILHILNIYFIFNYNFIS